MNEPLVIEDTYNAPIEKVWKAITDNDQMKKWYFNLAAFKPEVGFEFTFIAESEGIKYVHLCKITEVVPDKKIAYTWRYDSFPGNSEVTWELFPEGDKTKIKLTHTGLETFPQNNKDFTKASFTGGWTHFVGSALKNFVEQ